MAGSGPDQGRDGHVAYAIIGFLKCDHGRHLDFVTVTDDFGIIEDVMRGYHRKMAEEGKDLPDHYRVYKCDLATGRFLDDDISRQVYRFVPRTTQRVTQ